MTEFLHATFDARGEPVPIGFVLPMGPRREGETQPWPVVDEHSGDWFDEICVGVPGLYTDSRLCYCWESRSRFMPVDEAGQPLVVNDNPKK